MRTKQRRRRALAEYSARLRHLLAGELDAVLVYGSEARGEATEGSDIDVLVVLHGPFEHAEMLRRTSEATAEISLRHDVVLSRTFVTRQDLASRQTPFLMNVRREATAP